MASSPAAMERSRSRSGENAADRRTMTTIDANEAVGDVAYRINEVISIYPITPASPMGEWSDAWMAMDKPNIWNTVPDVVEMQSEAGAAGAVHGALQTGSLTTTFTASQGLLLMIPNLFKIAGELTPTVIHVAARTVATHALSIFGDHSDVMAARTTGFGMLASSSVQEAHDFTLISHAASLESSIPFIHFFDGFRTSHEIQKIERLDDDVLHAMITDDLVRRHRHRALSPDRPVIRGTAQNPDVFFQARETVNPYYDACADKTEAAMDRFAELTGRRYHPFDYHGAPDADRVIVLMGSGADATHETVDYMNGHGEKVGVIKVRLYRPFDVKRFIDSIPPSVKSIAVLDRTKEPGSAGEPLYVDCVTALHETGKQLRTVGGRYGLSSKEFTPAMVKGIFDNLALESPKNHFTVGIHDDVTHTSIDYDPSFSTEPDTVIRALFYGLGSDGTVGANKNTIKIIGGETENNAQGYFVYDSKKAGAVTVSHLRFGPDPIRSSYLVNRASFVACHQQVFLETYDMLANLDDGGTFLLNTSWSAEEVWNHLPGRVQRALIEKKAKFYIIDGYKVAHESGMGRRINTVMQVCFFAISGVLPRDEAIEKIKGAIQKTYGAKGDEIVKMNFRAVDNTLAHLHEVEIPAEATGNGNLLGVLPDSAPEFVKNVTAPIIAGKGDDLPVSAMPCDGTFPSGTTKWEKRNIALEIPVWDPEVCIQCAKCAIVCPHGVIRIKSCDPSFLEGAPATFKSIDIKDKGFAGQKYLLQVAPEDCTGCGVCVDICPAKNKKETRLKAINMAPQPPIREAEKENWEFFLTLPEVDRLALKSNTIRQQQMQQPLFEFSGACAGCGETPYLKLMSQLFGDRALIANATGCSSIYGGNLPTTPWTVNHEGRGPAWSNSLFEDNAEFGLGFRLSVDKQTEMARELVAEMAVRIGENLAKEILEAEQKDEADIHEQRQRVAALKEKLKEIDSPDAARLLDLADMLCRKSVWIVGGDGWAYDIGFGGLDHVLASGRNVNILVLDTEVYSNTGGQTSKSTPLAAVAKFSAGGKRTAKKDLGAIAMTYGNVYVASVAMGARDEHTLKAFIEAERYDGPSIIIAYSQCIAHGIDMARGMQNQKAAVQSGQWLLYRYNPERAAAGENPLQLDSRAPKLPLSEYLRMENRFKMLQKSRPADAERLWKEIQAGVNERWKKYEYLSRKEG